MDRHSNPIFMTLIARNPPVSLCIVSVKRTGTIPVMSPGLYTVPRTQNICLLNECVSEWMQVEQ